MRTVHAFLYILGTPQASKIYLPKYKQATLADLLLAFYTMFHLSRTRNAELADRYETNVPWCWLI
jgi:hypothetical protein